MLNLFFEFRFQLFNTKTLFHFNLRISAGMIENLKIRNITLTPTTFRSTEMFKKCRNFNIANSTALTCEMINNLLLVLKFLIYLLLFTGTGSFNLLFIGRVFTSGFLGCLASENQKSRENSYFSNSLKVKRVGKLQ